MEFDQNKKARNFMDTGLDVAFVFVGIIILLSIVTSLAPFLMGVLGNLTAALTDIPVVGTLFSKGGVFPLILMIAVFAAGIYQAVKMYRNK